MIVYTPLDLPKIEPDDWNTFWTIWNTHSDSLVKVSFNGVHSDSPVGRNDIWQGLDIFVSKNSTAIWTAPFYDIREELPNLYNTLATLPIPNIYRVRLVSSKQPVGPHSDDKKDTWVARAYLHYTAPTGQWYFIRPGDMGGQRSYITLPAETNWFAYNDKHCWHATEYDEKYPKILLQVFASSVPMELVNTSIEKYKEHTIRYD